MPPCDNSRRGSIPSPWGLHPRGSVQHMKRYYTTRAEPAKNYIKPGFGFVPRYGAQLWTVVGSSIAVTMFDHRLKIGGMAHYTRPYRMPGLDSSSFFAGPAIKWLLQCLFKHGARREDLEVQLFGGASSYMHRGYIQGLHEENVKVGVQLIKQTGLELQVMDVGGKRGRKVVFNSGTGESAVAHVDNIRAVDWYPLLESGASTGGRA